jgi:phospholipid/cholesterol/gamma-HCH transport system ATP-binding protein
MLELVDLRAGYGRTEVLHGVSLTAKERVTTAIIGSSGGGKSTLLKVIMGFLRASSGKLIIDGDDVTRSSEHEFALHRQKMGLVFQESALFDSLTVAENIGFFPFYREKKPWGKVVPLVKEMLDTLGLPGIENKYPAELSGGMRRRVALGRTLIYRPKILLYDEPTTGLDPTMISVVDDIIREMNEKFQVTSVLVSHDLESVLDVAEHVFLVHEGVAIDVGAPHNLLTSSDEIVRGFTKSWRDHVEMYRRLVHGDEPPPPRG